MCAAKMLITTYQHDYLPPNMRRYAFLKKPGEAEEKEKEICQCIEETKIAPPKAVLDQCANVEWTGIAPMGRLVEPRIIPTRFTPEQIAAMAHEAEDDCFKAQPNRFLKILRTLYPDLYERLKAMPKDELNRRIEKERLYTTYQIDYCGMNEYPEGVYASLKQEDDSSKMKVHKVLEREDPCAEFRATVVQELEREADGYGGAMSDPCEKKYQPFKISFTDSGRFTSSGNNSHWRTSLFAKRANFSEYMDTINRNGCVIMRNNIHNHAKCANGKHCKHALQYTCADLK